jgi:hypothetical protein
MPPPRALPARAAPAGALEIPAERTVSAAASPTIPTTTMARANPAPEPTAPAVVPPPAVALPAAVPPRAAPLPAAAAPPPAAAASVASSPVEAARPTPPDDAPDAPPRPSGRELETRAIQNTLGRYRNAFNSLDASAASAVWPTVNERTLDRAFERLDDQNVSFDRCQIEIVGPLAEAACSGSARYVPKVGSRSPKTEARHWTFSLRKAGDGWLIQSVDAR